MFDLVLHIVLLLPSPVLPHQTLARVITLAANCDGIHPLKTCCTQNAEPAAGTILSCNFSGSTHSLRILL